MMGRSVTIAGSLLLFAALVVALFLANLSAIGAYALTKLTGGKIEASKVRYRYEGGLIILTFSDLTLRGTISGSIGRLDVAAGVKGRPFFKSAAVTDFDLTVGDMRGESPSVPLPVECVEIGNGVVTYNRQRLIVDKIRWENLNNGKPSRFDLAVRNDFSFRSLTATGQGLYKGKGSAFTGSLRIDGVNLNTLSKNLKGTAAVEGPFAYGGEKFSLTGSLEVHGFAFEDRLLVKPLTTVKHTSEMTLTYGDSAADVKVNNFIIQGVPVSLSLRLERGNLTILELASGFFSVHDVKDSIATDTLAGGLSRLLSSVREGKARIAKLHYERAKASYADLELKEIDVMYNAFPLKNIEALLRVDKDTVTVSRGRGLFGSSRFTDAAGTISLAGDREVKVQANYLVFLEDIPQIVDVGDFKLRGGTAVGVMAVKGNQKEGYTISGKGTLQEGDVGWKTLVASARGSYRFTNDEISFDPLVITKGGTDMALRGTWKRKQTAISMKGTLDVNHLRQLVTLPLETEGTVGLDLALKKDALTWSIDGSVIMDNTLLAVPGFFKKEKGVRAVSRINASARERAVEIDHLSCDLDGLKIRLKGTVNPDRSMDLDVGVKIEGFERIGPLFFLEGGTSGGDGEIKVSFKDLTWPLSKLPHTTGFARISNGFLKLPWIAKPIREVDLYSEFSGEAFDMEIRRLVLGRTRLRNGRIRSEGREGPRFSLSLNFDSLDVSDFKSGKEFSIPSVNQDSIMAKTSGAFILRATGASLSDTMSGTNLHIRGEVRDRRLTISRLTMNTMGGRGMISGVADLSGPVPTMQAEGKISGIRGDVFLKSMGAKTSIIEGEGIISGNLSAKGERRQQFIETLQGKATAYSENGVIRRWNFLSKLFGLLNVYNLFRGKVPLTESGLTYKKMGATFQVKDGIFTTEDFLIDSPSMLITGKVDINAKTQHVQGTVTVSPLVALDRTIDKIPILRSILKRRNRGFLYAVYDVKGPLDDADLSLSVINTIGGRTIDLLRNILVLPIELFQREGPAVNGED